MNTPQINLLPADYRPARRLGMPQFVAAGVLFCLISGGALYYGGLVQEQMKLGTRLPALQMENEQVKAELGRATRLKEREDKAAQVEESFRRLKGRLWWPILLDFQDATPAGLSWETVEGGADQIRLQGQANGMNDVAGLVTGLAGSSRVEGVDMHQAVQGENGRFVLDLTVRLVPEEGNVP